MEAPKPKSISPVSSTAVASSDDLLVSSSIDNGCSNLSLNDIKKQVDEVKKFATLLGSSAASSDARSKELTSLISVRAADDEVVLLLPAVEVIISDGTNGGEGSSGSTSNVNTLPKVGEHSTQLGAFNAKPGLHGGRTLSLLSGWSHFGDSSKGTPSMKASVLTRATDGDAVLEQNAAQNIGKETSWTKSTLPYASTAASSNISSSFGSLMNSRIKAWTLLLLRHSLTTGDGESRKRLLNMLHATVKVDSAETTFKTLPLPDSVAAQPKDADVILPLLFEACLKITIEGKTENVVLLAPGTISANFEGESSGIRKVIIRLDTGVLLKSMVDQARIIVFKAVASATKTVVPLISVAPGAVKDVKKDTCISIDDVPKSASSLAGFRSALNLSPSAADRSPMLQKARSSALRLNSVLHGKSTATPPSLGLRKLRSVKWDSPAEIPKIQSSQTPSPKKPRIIETNCKLKSFKSFGRPHGGDFGSGPRNATFGEYGGRQQFWGRDGRMAQPPKPMQAMPSNYMMEAAASPDKNATFDFLRVNRARTTSSSPPRSLPRTATALENWLISKSTTGGSVTAGRCRG